MPSYGTKAFKELTIKMFFRKSFIEQAYDEAAVAIAHELSHVVLESIRHPMRRCEKVVDLTAMLLGFRSLYASGSHKEQHFGNTISFRSIGYLRPEEIKRANRFLAQGDERPTIKTVSSRHALMFGVIVFLVFGVVIWATFGPDLTGFNIPGTDPVVRNVERECIERQRISAVNRQRPITIAQAATFCNCYSEEIETKMTPNERKYIGKEGAIVASLQETIDLIISRCNHEAFGE
jgi:hypothetical protein